MEPDFQDALKARKDEANGGRISFSEIVATTVDDSVTVDSFVSN
jgi:hypothetical protein